MTRTAAVRTFRLGVLSCRTTCDPQLIREVQALESLCARLWNHWRRHPEAALPATDMKDLLAVNDGLVPHLPLRYHVFVWSLRDDFVAAYRSGCEQSPPRHVRSWYETNRRIPRRLPPPRSLTVSDTGRIQAGPFALHLDGSRPGRERSPAGLVVQRIELRARRDHVRVWLHLTERHSRPVVTNPSCRRVLLGAGAAIHAAEAGSGVVSWRTAAQQMAGVFFAFLSALIGVWLSAGFVQATSAGQQVNATVDVAGAAGAVAICLTLVCVALVLAAVGPAFARGLFAMWQASRRWAVAATASVAAVAAASTVSALVALFVVVVVLGFVGAAVVEYEGARDPPML